MKISDGLLHLLKEEEGYSSKPYLCPANKWTIGYGSTFYENGTPVTKNDQTIDEKRAGQIVDAHMAREVYPTIQKHVKVQLTQNEFDALCSFIYNVGSANFKSSTLLKKINLNDKVGAASEFLKWDKARDKNGNLVALPGLTRRRKKESELFKK